MKYRLLGNSGLRVSEAFLGTRSLDQASGIEMGFPYYLYSKVMTRGLAYGGLRNRIIA